MCDFERTSQSIEGADESRASKTESDKRTAVTDPELKNRFTSSRKDRQSKVRFVRKRCLITVFVISNKSWQIPLAADELGAKEQSFTKIAETPST
jgi:hypothetical protein